MGRKACLGGGGGTAISRVHSVPAARSAIKGRERRAAGKAHLSRPLLAKTPNKGEDARPS